MPAVTLMRNSLHRNIPSPSSPIKEGTTAMNLQGIVTILGSDSTDKNNFKNPASIRRTLSADMSSKKWLQQNGFFSPMKKISSSEVLNQSSEEEETTSDQDEVWRTIQAQKQRNADDQVRNSTQLAVWGSILQSQKTDGSDLLPPPYVHPLVKRSSSTLSEKSLEICTESLGSETGSDEFSSYPDSESSGDGNDHDHDHEQEFLSLKASDPFEDFHVVKYKESPARPFPPPLNSIAGAGGDWASVHMQSRRENGRLLLEAISVPPRNFFQAERRDGRLVLTLLNSPVSEKTEEMSVDIENDDEDEKVGDGGGADVYEDEEEEEMVLVEEKIEKIEKDVEKITGIISLKKTGVLMKKFIALRNINPTWNTNKMDAAELLAAAMVEEEAAVEGEKIPLIHSLPPRPPVALILAPPAATSFNPYEYFWRNKTTAGAGVTGGFVNNPPLKLNKNMGTSNRIIKTYENHHQELVGRRGNKTEYLVQDLRGCKEPKRSLLIWEPYCIATS